MKFNLTSAQDILLQGVLSALASALLGAFAAGVQYITAHGLNVPTLLSIILVSFAGLFGNALKNFVPGHVQQEMQAYKDTIAQLQALLGMQQQLAPTVKRASIVPARPVSPVQSNVASSQVMLPSQQVMQSDNHGG